MLLRATFLPLFIASCVLVSHVVRSEEASLEEENEPEVEAEVGAEAEAEIEAEANAETEENSSDVTDLTPENIDSFLADNSPALVEFYAPWCGHCKSFAPEYEKIGTYLKENLNLATAKIDCDAHGEACRKYEVNGYPTIKIFKDNEPFDYTGDRNFDEMIDKMEEMNDPDWAPPLPAVVELTKENFDDIITQDFALVMFYAPWCGHCKKMKPAFEQAANELRDDPIPDIKQQPVIAMLDATVEGDIAKRYEVTGYPTLKIFRQGSVSEYKGGREAMNIVDEVVKYMAPASTEFATVNEAKRRVLDTVGNSVLCFCIDESNEEMMKNMEEIANDFRNDWLDVHRVASSEMQEAIKCQPGDTFLVHDKSFRSKQEPERFTITSADDVRENKKPLVGQIFKPKEAALYFDEDKPTVRIYAHFDFTPKYRKASQIIRAKVLNVAKKFKNDFYFGLMDEDEHRDSMNACHMEDSPDDVNVCVTQGKKKVWPLLDPEDDFSEELLTDFLEKIKNQKIKPFVKSAKAPKKNDGPVKVVVANEFDKIVMDSEKDVLIEFYAPWCGHCKSLEPIYKKLGKFYQSESDLTIAKMDLIANDLSNEKMPEVSGFPTIYYVDKENNVEKYEAGRDLKSFKKFLAEKRALGKLPIADKDEL